MAHDVFLSYSSKDKSTADAACAVLEKAGIRVWMAPRDILPGIGWGASVLAAITNARVMVLVFSENANASPHIEREVERTINNGLPVIPFRIENIEPSEALEYFISASHWLDAFSEPLEKHLDRLADVVRRVIETKYGIGALTAEAEAAQRTEEELRQREQAEAAQRSAEAEEQRKAEQALRESQEAERAAAEREALVRQQAEEERLRQAEAAHRAEEEQSQKENEEAARAADTEQQAKAEAARRPGEESCQPGQAIQQERCQGDDAGAALRTEEEHRREEPVEIARPLMETPLDHPPPPRRKVGSGMFIVMALAGLAIIIFGALLWQGERKPAGSNGENPSVPSNPPKGNPVAQAAPEGSAGNSGVAINNGAVLSQGERKLADSNVENPSVPSNPPKGNPDAQAAAEGSAGNSGVVSNSGAIPEQCRQIPEEIQKLDRDEDLARKPIEDNLQVEDSMLAEVFENGDPHNKIIDQNKWNSTSFRRKFNDNRRARQELKAEEETEWMRLEHLKTQALYKINSLRDCDGIEFQNTMVAYNKERNKMTETRIKRNEQRSERLKPLFK
jgi:hypothetical protein